VFEFEGVSVFEFVFEFVFEGGRGERARSGAGWRFSSAMPKSSKTVNMAHSRSSNRSRCSTSD